MEFQVYNKLAARAYGTEASVLLTQIFASTQEHRKHDLHFHDGRYWMYNSVASWHRDFPFMSEMKIRRILKKLVQAGVILTGRYNTNACDRTLWYALTDAGEAIFTQDILPDQYLADREADTTECTDDPSVPSVDTDVCTDPGVTTKGTDAASIRSVHMGSGKGKFESVCSGEFICSNGTLSTGVEGGPIPNNSPNNSTNNSTNISFHGGAAPRAEEKAFDHSLPLRGDERRRITDTELRKWRELYPGVDIENELRRMRGWLESRPHRRYDRLHIDPFIHRWFANSLEQIRRRLHAEAIAYADEDSVFD